MKSARESAEQFKSAGPFTTSSELAAYAAPLLREAGANEKQVATICAAL